MRRPGLVWGTLVIGLLSAATLWGMIDLRYRDRRLFNIRSAEARTKYLAAAQADFRGNDLDRNGIQDFWTGDVAGLYQFGLIERAVAMADLRPITPLCPVPIPADGYYYVALDVDFSAEPPEAYRQDTDGSGQRVRNLHRFGFMAIPAKGEHDGSSVIINEGNSLFWNRQMWTPAQGWPCDDDRKMKWSRR